MLCTLKYLKPINYLLKLFCCAALPWWHATLAPHVCAPVVDFDAEERRWSTAMPHCAEVCGRRTTDIGALAVASPLNDTSHVLLLPSNQCEQQLQAVAMCDAPYRVVFFTGELSDLWSGASLHPRALRPWSGSWPIEILIVHLVYSPLAQPAHVFPSY